MRVRSLRGPLVALLSFVCVATSASAAESYSVIPNLHFIVHVGPGQTETCNVIGDLYRPADATAAHPDPAILTTNGFGGSKNNQATLAEQLASNGYVVLSYSGLGFGGSGCQIEFDSPEWDGEAASQLITFLGGGSAATNGTTVNYVIHDAVAHNGIHYADDPRVGMIGGSYGGQIQFAAADDDPRIDTLIPIITWNDLSYSLAPNNTALTPDGVTASIPGVTKFEWVDLFGLDGLLDGVVGAGVDPTRLLTGCPNFDSRACAVLVGMDALGYPDATGIGVLRAASVESYVQNIKIPVMLMQGEDDTLFNLHEAVATYTALRAEKTPVKMVWQSWGHSDGTPAPGELGPGDALDNAGGGLTAEGRLVLEWFNHYLMGNALAPALDFSFFRPWVSYAGTNAAAAYASAPSYPIGTPQSLYLSGSDALVASPAAVTSGTAAFTTPALGLGQSTTEVSGVNQSVALYDAPGTFAEYQSAPLSTTTDVVGIPAVRLQIGAPLGSSAALDPASDLTLFFKLEDIAPDGTVTLPDRLISPARFAALGAPVTVTLPGIVHRFAAGDRIALVIAGSDAAYRGGAIPIHVTIASDPSAPGVLTLPVAGAGSYGPLQYGSVPAAHGRPHHSRPRHRARRHRRSGHGRR